MALYNISCVHSENKCYEQRSSVGLPQGTILGPTLNHFIKALFLLLQAYVLIYGAENLSVYPLHLYLTHLYRNYIRSTTPPLIAWNKLNWFVTAFSLAFVTVHLLKTVCFTRKPLVILMFFEIMAKTAFKATWVLKCQSLLLYSLVTFLIFCAPRCNWFCK